MLFSQFIYTEREGKFDRYHLKFFLHRFQQINSDAPTNCDSGNWWSRLNISPTLQIGKEFNKKVEFCDKNFCLQENLIIDSDNKWLK